MEKKIFLLADDDMDDKEMFCEALEAIDSNIACYTVSDGREALDILNSMHVHPQLIFLDINMPVMNGWQCLEKLKGDERYRDIPVIIISTSSHQREIDIARTLNASCYFTKPHQFSELTYALRTIVYNLDPQWPLTLRDTAMRDSKYIHTLSPLK